MALSRRLRRLEMERGFGLDKYAIVAFLRKLPEDARIMSFYEDPAQNVSGVVVHSESYDHVQMGEMIPVDHTTITTEDVHRERMLGGTVNLPPEYMVDYGALEERVMALCTCDLAYTGAKHHNRGCPLA